MSSRVQVLRDLSSKGFKDRTIVDAAMLKYERNHNIHEDSEARRRHAYDVGSIIAIVVEQMTFAEEEEKVADTEVVYNMPSDYPHNSVTAEPEPEPEPAPRQWVLQEEKKRFGFTKWVDRYVVLHNMFLTVFKYDRNTGPGKGEQRHAWDLTQCLATNSQDLATGNRNQVTVVLHTADNKYKTLKFRHANKGPIDEFSRTMSDMKEAAALRTLYEHQQAIREYDQTGDPSILFRLMQYKLSWYTHKNSGLAQLKQVIASLGKNNESLQQLKQLLILGDTDGAEWHKRTTQLLRLLSQYYALLLETKKWLTLLVDPLRRNHRAFYRLDQKIQNNADFSTAENVVFLRECLEGLHDLLQDQSKDQLVDKWQDLKENMEAERSRWIVMLKSLKQQYRLSRKDFILSAILSLALIAGALVVFFCPPAGICVAIIGGLLLNHALAAVVLCGVGVVLVFDLLGIRWYPSVIRITKSINKEFDEIISAARHLQTMVSALTTEIQRVQRATKRVNSQKDPQLLNDSLACLVDAFKKAGEECESLIQAVDIQIQRQM